MTDLAQGAPPPTIAVDLRALVPRPTGIGVYTRSLLEALARRGSARYVGMAHAPIHWEEDLRRAGVEVERQEAPLGLIWQQWHFRRRLARGDVDLAWSPLAVLPWSLAVPGVVTVHDLTAFLFPETHTLKVRLSLVPFLRRTLRTARRIVAISEATAADLLRYEPGCAERVRVVYNGVDDAFQPASPEQIEAVRRELDAPEGYLLYTGTLEPRKNVGRILDAWEALREADPATPPLLVAGASGWRSDEVHARLEALEAKGLRRLGHVDRGQLIRIFQGARAFVYPSLYEGFGLPPAEAMACAVPVVVSNASSLPEVVGDAGLQVDPESTEDLAAALKRVLSDDDFARDLGERGRRRVQRFSWDRAAEQMEEVFREAMAESR